MPYKPNFVYWQKLMALLKYSFSFNPKPVLGASGLILLASLLLMAVFGSLRSGSMPPFTAPMVSTQAEPQKAVEVKAAEAAPSAPVIGMQEPVTKETAKTPVAVWPIKGKILKDVGWYENTVLKEWRYHGAYDIEGQERQEVKAMLDGEVTDVYNTASSGLTVVIRHGEYVVQYGSLASTAVKKGDAVEGGSAIGTIGSFPAEPFLHLHISIKKGDKIIDPHEIIK